MKQVTCAGVLAALVSIPAAAQIGSTDTSQYPSYEPGPEVKNGYTAEDLRDANIRGSNGEKIGSIEDLIIGPDGKLRRVLVSVNEGFLGIGGRMLAVDFEDLQPGRRDDDGDVEYFIANVSKQNVEEHGIFKDRQEAKAGKREWRASELVGDYVSLKDQNEYGIVKDLMFDQQGQLRGVATAADVSGSVLPFWTAYSGDDEGWDPGDDYYVLPYSTQQIAELLPAKQGPETRVSSGPDESEKR